MTGSTKTGITSPIVGAAESHRKGRIMKKPIRSTILAISMATTGCGSIQGEYVSEETRTFCADKVTEGFAVESENCQWYGAWDIKCLESANDTLNQNLAVCSVAPESCEWSDTGEKVICK